MTTSNNNNAELILSALKDGNGMNSLMIRNRIDVFKNDPKGTVKLVACLTELVARGTVECRTQGNRSLKIYCLPNASNSNASDSNVNNSNVNGNDAPNADCYKVSNDTNADSNNVDSNTSNNADNSDNQKEQTMTEPVTASQPQTALMQIEKPKYIIDPEFRDLFRPLGYSLDGYILPKGFPKIFSSFRLKIPLVPVQSCVYFTPH